MERHFFKHKNELIVSLSQDNGCVISIEENQPAYIESCTMISGYEDKDCFLVLRVDLETMTTEDVTDELAQTFCNEIRKMKPEEIAAFKSWPEYVSQEWREEMADLAARREVA